MVLLQVYQKLTAGVLNRRYWQPRPLHHQDVQEILRRLHRQDSQEILRRLHHQDVQEILCRLHHQNAQEILWICGLFEKELGRSVGETTFLPTVRGDHASPSVVSKKARPHSALVLESE